MFGFTARSNDVVFFPVEILTACELAGQGQMLLEMVEIVCEGPGLDLRDILGPEYGSNALILFVQFSHNVTSHHRGGPPASMILLMREEDKQRWGWNACAWWLTMTTGERICVTPTVNEVRKTLQRPGACLRVDCGMRAIS